MNLYRNSILIGIILFGLHAHCQTVGPWNTNVLFQTPSYSTTTDVEAVGMTSLYYETIDYLGNPVETFAYYSAPDGPVPAGGWPAVVLVHGGGHSASANYVRVWNDNGFAAIAMDTEGRLPVKVNGVRVVAPKPGPRRDGVWDDSELPIEDQWYYHAVALIIRGHSLIRSFPEVNPNKTGVSGFSWGGTLTSTVMGVDNRFSFAVPVYGAGFLSESDGHQGTAMSAAEAVVVNTYFDGSVYFDNVTYPTMWVNGTNDHHFALTTQQKSSRAVNGPTFLRYTLGMAHGGTPPRLVEEIYAFAQNVVNGAPTLPVLGNPQIASNTASVTFSANSNVTSGKLYYTLDEGKWNERQWNETNASVSGNTISANVPSGATTIYFGATNSLGYVTSEYLLTDGADPGGGTGNVNLALNGTATQSTTLNGGVASRAIDDNTAGNFGSGNGSVTAAQGPNAWWEVDLGDSYSIDNINVFNRTDACCKSRLSDFTVSVINSSGTTTYTQTITTAPNPSVTLDAGGAIGQVVRIQSNLTTTLNLAEVEVYGSQSNTNTNNTITIQENATGFCDVDGVIQSADAGYTGIGYANTSNAMGRAIDWEIDGAAGSYTFVWRYLVGSPRTANLIVDGTTVASGISFVNTQGGWLTAEATVSLGAGVKSIILSSTSSMGLAKIDYVEVTGPNVAVSGCTNSANTSSARTSSGTTTLGVETSDADGVLYVFPNPVTDILNVKISGSKTAQLDIINYAGQRVLSQNIKVASAVVDLSSLSSGVYILKVTDGQQVQTKKIIKK